MVTAEGGSRVLINPIVLLAAFGINKIAKFLLPLQSSNGESFLAVVIYEELMFKLKWLHLPCKSGHRKEKL
jgi:hypothetical protein